ncbi:hypothetical protein [Peptostreptococcus faecalis]|uniref:hypothetical protein n=1 Tax=Peptostreptococcus faecalis TaxID=2045015 RepID=UPI000C7D35D4|nr:hypothetical protein [Peptostreptococcus faecalis]
MKKNINIFIVSTLLLLSVLLLFACSKENKTPDKNIQKQFIEDAINYNNKESNKKRDRFIVTKSNMKFSDGTTSSISSKMILNSSPMSAKMTSSNDKNIEGFYQFLNNDKSVDFYTNTKNQGLDVRKNVDKGLESLYSAMSTGSLTGSANDYKIIGEENLDNKITCKLKKDLSLSEYKKHIDNLVVDGIVDEKFVKENKYLRDIINDLDENGFFIYYWVEKNTHKLLKMEMNNSLSEFVSYYYNNKNGKKPPISTIVTTNFQYDNVEKLKRPTN